MTVILLVGKRRSGKDTVANFLTTWFTAIGLKLSAPLKGNLLQIKGLAHFPETLGIRNSLQELGDYCLLHDKHIFCAQLYALYRLITDNRIYQIPLVVSDVRYPHEVEFFKDKFDDVRVWKIERPVERNSHVDRHRSETSADEIVADVVFENTSSIASLLTQVLDEALKIPDFQYSFMLKAPLVYLSQNITVPTSSSFTTTYEYIVNTLKKHGWSVVAPKKLSNVVYMERLMRDPQYAQHIVETDIIGISLANAVFGVFTAASFGGGMELLLAKQQNKPVVVFTPVEQLRFHPFIVTLCDHVCSDVNDALQQFFVTTGTYVVQEYKAKESEKTCENNCESK